MDIPALQSHAKASVLPFDKFAANPKVSQQAKVEEACRQFEAVLLRKILGEARKSVLASTSGESASIAGIYDDMINNQMADNISRSGAFGLAKSLQTQLVHQVLPKSDAVAANAKAAPAVPQSLKPTLH
jgi:Rod binding domain-containing protein